MTFPISAGTVTTLAITTFEPEWEFPYDRFVVYEKSDEAWARPLGFGKEVMREHVWTIPNAVIERIEGGSGNDDSGSLGVQFKIMPQIDLLMPVCPVEFSLVVESDIPAGVMRKFGAMPKIAYVLDHSDSAEWLTTISGGDDD